MNKQADNQRNAETARPLAAAAQERLEQAQTALAVSTQALLKLLDEKEDLSWIQFATD